MFSHLSKEDFCKLAASCDSTADVYDRLKAFHDIAEKRAKLERELQATVERHRAELDDIQARLDGLRRQCEHPIAEYHADPAGGSDSHYYCTICGATLRK